MKKLIISFFFCILSVCLWGQNTDSIAQAIQDELWNRIGALTLQLDEKNQTIMRLREDSLSMQDEISRQKKRIGELEKTADEAHALASQSKKDFETIKGAVLSKDAVLYKQCLLYPLERRYNPSLIEDALNTIEVFAGLGQMSDKFVEYKTTYEPLLNQYGQYNQQVKAFLQGCIEYIEIREEKLGEGAQIPVPGKWLNELKTSPYYTECYLGKDLPPYRSIAYLDEVIDEFMAVIVQPGPVKPELQRLVKKLEPKK